MELVGFIAVVLLAYLIPGPDFLLVSRYAVQHKQLGFTAALGAQSGLCLHMLMAAMGLSAIAAQSAELFFNNTLDRCRISVMARYYRPA
ncbi:LysE family transporter [Halomonas sp. HAL1]|uniref:LysE family transporter n=1 Tax=Halomonas sp. HAL1 TaxID=550984 RepID=UPI00022D32DB|nr:LysE family transporter [Halomonas sp. HAL1]EHA15887.1 lysine exporter protein LysE/YggA [Halomonas sp. HAL1]WKV93843.1 LysE family transporter [Halomonas sp. HAL1]